MKVERQLIKLSYDEGLYCYSGDIDFVIEGNEITDVNVWVEITHNPDRDNYPEISFGKLVCKDEFSNEVICPNYVNLIKNLEESLVFYYL